MPLDRDADPSKPTLAGAVVVAAGQSQRMGQDKLFLPLLDAPVLAWTLDAFERCADIHAVALVLSGSNHEAGVALVRERGFSKVRHVCIGGARRQDSVLSGLRLLDSVEWVAIHDGARPLATPDLISRGISAARLTGAAVAGVPVKDTIKAVGQDDSVAHTPERARLRSIQTPQIFRRDLLLRAYEVCHDDVTDDAGLVERLGVRVRVYPGSYDNLKITTAEDLVLAEALLRSRGR